MSVLSGVGRFFFLLRSYYQMLSEQSHPMSNFQDRAKHPTLVIPPPKATTQMNCEIFSFKNWALKITFNFSGWNTGLMIFLRLAHCSPSWATRPETSNLTNGCEGVF
ncbi:unnamed protein product, partial [Vitis vinifera]|uniref:Uncharacterized protein n=1 Tax=Vitis vinifera TaxID=29760 RepID=D7UB26_VITVI